jgi:hypothetical protein
MPKGLRNCVTIKAILYILIASLTGLVSDLSDFKSFNEIGQIKALIIVINIILQGCIAWRAFLDQSVGRARIDSEMRKKEERQLQIITEGPQ